MLRFNWDLEVVRLLFNVMLTDCNSIFRGFQWIVWIFPIRVIKFFLKLVFTFISILWCGVREISCCVFRFRWIERISAAVRKCELMVKVQWDLEIFESSSEEE